MKKLLVVTSEINKMTSSTTGLVKTIDEQLLVLRDLESLLRKSIGKNVTLVNCEVNTLIPKGENFAGTILKVDATIKRAKDSDEEELPLVAKMITMNAQFNGTASFGKEMFVFEKLIPTYRQLEKEVGVEESDLFDILPKYYGGRLSLSKDTPHEADENAVMLMENLKERGYYTADRMIGLDYEHAKLAIQRLAHYHALGTALHIKRPKVFEEAKNTLNVFPFDIRVDEFNEVVDHIIALICEDSRIAQHGDRIRKAVDAANRGMNFFLKVDAVEPWISITHGDFWVNNIMFHKDNGNLDDAKFIDYQLTKICSPLVDLPYFLFGSCRIDVIDEHFDDLVNNYYLIFIETLKKLDCDTSSFAREKFDEQLNKDAVSEMFRCFFAIKFFTFEASDDKDMSDIKSSIIFSGVNKEFFERSWKCASKYIEKKWL